MEREEARKIATINEFARSHSYHGGLVPAPEYTPTPEEEDSYNTPWQDAREWMSGSHPDWVSIEEKIDDGDSHDVSTVAYYIASVDEDEIHIFSYNNNAWGHCDIYHSYDTPQDISDWLSQWDDLPEKWLEDYAE